MFHTAKLQQKLKEIKLHKKVNLNRLGENNGEFTKYVSRTRNGNRRVRTKKISASRAEGIARRLKKKYK